MDEPGPVGSCARRFWTYRLKVNKEPYPYAWDGYDGTTDIRGEGHLEMRDAEWENIKRALRVRKRAGVYCDNLQRFVAGTSE